MPRVERLIVGMARDLKQAILEADNINDKLNMIVEINNIGPTTILLER